MSDTAAATVIDDPRDPRLRKVVELLKGKNKVTRAVLIDDAENIVEALRHDVHLFTVFVTEGDDLGDDVLDLLPAEVDVQEISVRVSKELFGVERRSRVFALARRPRPWSVPELLDVPGDVIVLDGVRLMGNIGAIARSTKALGFAGIVLLDSAITTVMDRRLIRASRGMVFALPTALSDADTVLAELRERGITMVSLEPRVPTPLSAVADLPGRVALLLGSEKHGPSRRLSEAAHEQVTIDIHPDVESLNVSVSAALAMYQRRGSNPLPAPGRTPSDSPA